MEIQHNQPIQKSNQSLNRTCNWLNKNKTKLKMVWPDYWAANVKDQRQGRPIQSHLKGFIKENMAATITRHFFFIQPRKQNFLIMVYFLFSSNCIGL